MGMNIDKVPGVTFYELDSDPTLNGEGAKIPIFIGKSASATAEPKRILKFKNSMDANRTVANGGIIPNNDTTTANPLLNFIKDFFTEAARTETDQIGVPYFYVIDLGKNPTAANWTQAMDTAKAKEDIQVEVYVGTYDINIMNDAAASIQEDIHTGNPRIALFPAGPTGATVSQMCALTDETQKTEDNKDNFIQKSRIYLIEPDFYGVTVARICVTPYYEEPGYNAYRSIEPGTFYEREPEEEIALQNAGIIFNHDETTLKNIYPKINLAVSTAFAKGDLRPNDSLMHARVNTDHLIREIYEVCYAQIKRNETISNLKFLKTGIDVAIHNEVNSGYMQSDTEANVEESDSNPYQIKVTGKALPVNSTLFIGFGMYVGEPSTKIVDSI